MFWKAFDKAVKGLAKLEAYRLANATADVLEASAINLPLKDDAVDLIITSPPYLDSVDYMYNFMLEYFWLGKRLGVPSRSRFNELRRSQMGAKRPDDLSASCLPDCLHGLIEEADIAPSRVGATRAYCSNMSKHFESASRVLKADARYVLVVGNSKTGDGVLPMHDALIRLAADAGFQLEKAFSYRIRRHYMKFPRAGRGGIITMDWVIVMRNARRAQKYPERLPLPDFTLKHDEVAN
jgi:tRNA G10  N-methylase Trm11